MKHRCINCFEEYDDELEICPYCGYSEGDGPKEPYVLTQGTILKDRYRIGTVIGVGGFGITYKAWDEKLDIVVAIKEYYPTGLVNRVPGTKEVVLYAVNRKDIYDHGLTRFLDEARNMAKFGNHKNIVNIGEYFEENGTAYIAMEFLDGLPLDKYLKSKKLTVDESLDIIFNVCNALKEIHKNGIIHRDISPDNIFICKNGTVKLLDFGAARFSQDEDKQLTIILKPGYAPPEQYEKVNIQGPWTDIYALGATLYLMLTREKPEESTNRKITDTLKSPHELNKDIPVYVSNSVMKAMAIDVHLRFQSVADFEKGLRNQRKTLTIKQERRKRKIKRAAGIMVSLCVIGALGGYFLKNWNQNKEEETLPDADITLWLRLTGEESTDEAKQGAFKAVIDEFLVSFPNVTINIEGYSGDEYNDKLKQAKEAGAMPNLYESEDLTEELLTDTLDLTSISKSDYAGACLFFDEYSKWFPDKNRIPLGFSMPALYINTTMTDFSEDTLTSVEQLSAKPSEGISDYAFNVKWKEQYRNLLGDDFIDSNTFSSKEEFCTSKAVYYLGSTADFFVIQESLPARFSMVPVVADSISAQFDYVFSISKSSKNENKAAMRFLQYMLSENSQDQLHVQNISTYLPINENTLDVFGEVYLDYAPFFDYMNKLSF